MRHLKIYQSIPQLSSSVRKTIITESQCISLFAQAVHIETSITDQKLIERIARLIHDAIAQLDADDYIAFIRDYDISVSPVSETMPAPKKNDTLLIFDPSSESITLIEQIDLADESNIYSSDSYQAGRRYAEVNWHRQQAPVIEARPALIYGEYMMGYYQKLTSLQERVLEAYRLHAHDVPGKYIIDMTSDFAEIGEIRNIAHPEASFKIMAECILSGEIHIFDDETREHTGTTYRTIWTPAPRKIS